MTDFQSMGLPEALTHTLQHMQFTTPTPVQAQAIPLALSGRDILGSAQTGTGKTGAFGIPLAAHLIKNPDSHALVLAPTRELATQVMAQLQAMMGQSAGKKSALLIGGDSMPKQIQKLQNRPRLIVGTPGRIHDHLKRRTLNFEHTDFVVLDETDRMLDMGFSVQIAALMKFMPEKRQTLLFSATLPKNIMNVVNLYLTDPARVAVDNPMATATNVTQENVKLKDDEKYRALLDALINKEGSVIVFSKTKHGSARMAKNLKLDGHKADAIHGDLRQNKRERVIKAFREQKFRVLVATDVAARGLDIPHIEHVINYDLPQNPEDYIHRIGRTGRAGASGAALNFISPSEKSKWAAIDRLLNPTSAEDADGTTSASSRGAKKPSRRVRKSSNSNRPFGRSSGGPRKEGGFKASGPRKDNGFNPKGKGKGKPPARRSGKPAPRAQA